MVVLSLFDGMSCGRIALEKAGIPFTKYYAGEIDKYAQIISAANYPDIIRLGDVTKWREWDIETPDMIIGGSPCQGFSFAGKQLNFDDPRSKLFFVMADILRHFKPKYFLLENVLMKKEYENVISETLGEIFPETAEKDILGKPSLKPVMINSALLSAQNRRRLYWANFPITQPADKGIVLRDILEEDIPAKIGAFRGRNPENPSDRTAGVKCEQRLEIRADLKGHDIIKRVYSVGHKSPTLTAICDGNQEPKIAIEKYSKRSAENIIKNTKGPEQKSIALTQNGNTTGSGVTLYSDGLTWRKLTPVECERLQTVPDNYTAHVSNSQRYKMLGNGWTVDVIAHIFKELFK